MARLLYREWFVHFRFPGHESVELVDSELGTIPEGWSKTCLIDQLDLCRMNIKPFEYTDEEFDHYSIPAYDHLKLPSLELGDEIRSNKYLLPNESVMISKLNPKSPRVWYVNRSCYNRRAVTSTEFLVLTNPVKWTLSFIYGLVSSTEFSDYLAMRAGGTSTSHQRVKPTDVMNMTVINPPTDVIDEYSVKVKPLLELIDNLLQQIKVLKASRDLLLPRLVSGDLDMSDLELELEASGL